MRLQQLGSSGVCGQLVGPLGRIGTIAGATEWPANSESLVELDEGTAHTGPFAVLLE